MSEVSSNNKRLAKNTIMLYFRMVLLMFVGLYTSRVILRTLGIADYGLFNVIAGVVALFGFLNVTLSSSTQRFLNYEMGRGDERQLKNVFSTSLLIHILIVAAIIILAETIGYWFVTNKLVIEVGREVAAVWVYQCVVVCVALQVFQLPFMSAIIAHEKMGIYAYISIIEGVLKLVIVFILAYAPMDKLILYGILYMVVQVVVAILYITYSIKQFAEARIRFTYDRRYFKEILGFSGWNLVGSVAYVANNQGVNVILNLFFGSVINAARGVAVNVNGIMSQLVSNFQVAIKPQVIKYYAAGQMEEMQTLVFNAAKFSALLMSVIIVPLMLEIDTVLTVWLGEYPSYAPVFLSLIFLQTIITTMTNPIVMVAHATGHLKEIGIYAGGTQIMVLPISYLLLYFGAPPITPFIICILGSLVEVFIELYWMRHYISFPLLDFYKKVYMPVFSLFVLIALPSSALHYIMSDSNQYSRFFVVGICSVLYSLTLIYIFATPPKIKEIIKQKLRISHKINNNE